MDSITRYWIWRKWCPYRTHRSIRSIRAPLFKRQVNRFASPFPTECSIFRASSKHIHKSGNSLASKRPRLFYLQQIFIQASVSVENYGAVPENSTLEDQFLTSDNIPVAIDKCINFVATYGADTPNVYLQTSQSPVAETIVEAFHSNPWEIQLNIDKHSVHDITTALTLFLKSMSECILTEKLYHNWIKANGLS